MQQIDVLARTIGLNFKEGKAMITVWAPLAQKVTVVTDGVSVALEKKAYGYWQATTGSLPEGTRYKIAVDDKQPLPDPASLSQPDGVHGASEAFDVTAFPWIETNWNNPP
ncbi:MAG TPA: malto-oligosyltrehalose trehalohydrolase, partial [Flavisolibacter sp.]|nr:malto-oligosyltrehalose trehalohydrolase [Flavisolibacter sp.]